MRPQGEGERPVVLGGTAFLVRVQSRENASWQGTVQWLDRKKTVPFRSTLELMMLIQEALDQAGPDNTHAFLGW